MCAAELLKGQGAGMDNKAVFAPLDACVDRAQLQEALRLRPQVFPKRLGELLCQDGLLTVAQLDHALSLQAAEPDRKLGSILETLGIATPEIVCAALARSLPCRLCL